MIQNFYALVRAGLDAFKFLFVKIHLFIGLDAQMEAFTLQFEHEPQMLHVIPSLELFLLDVHC
jgi:hypothetical protein